MPRIGRQTPTRSVVLPYTVTKGDDAIAIYNESGRTAQEWQTNIIRDILALNDDGLWTHAKYGYSVPRRNGKNEIISIVELYGIINGERILHTAHRTTTSHSASERLVHLLDCLGYEEVQRVKKNETYDKHYTYSKQFGLERVTILGEGGGYCCFRTRTAKGGLGEGFDLLIIDEAQEYTDDSESSLKYVVSDSRNPHTIMCGTPPTAVSSGTVFQKYRELVLSGQGVDSGWAEWSVDKESDPNDIDLWYECNPSLGTILTERSIRAEIGKDVIDFNIQRFGLWLAYSQKSAITAAEWNALKVDKKPKLKGDLFVGVKYSKQTINVSLSVACRTDDGRIFISCVDCRDRREGEAWLIKFLSGLKSVNKIVVDGAPGQDLLTDAFKKSKINKPLFPSKQEIITAYSLFERGLYSGDIVHMGQPSVDQSVTNCKKRSIGASGFGYESLYDEIDVSILESVVFAYWACNTAKDRKPQRVGY